MEQGKVRKPRARTVSTPIAELTGAESIKVMQLPDKPIHCLVDREKVTSSVDDPSAYNEEMLEKTKGLFKTHVGDKTTLEKLDVMPFEDTCMPSPVDPPLSAHAATLVAQRNAMARYGATGEGSHLGKDGTKGRSDQPHAPARLAAPALGEHAHRALSTVAPDTRVLLDSVYKAKLDEETVIVKLQTTGTAAMETPAWRPLREVRRIRGPAETCLLLNALTHLDAAVGRRYTSTPAAARRRTPTCASCSAGEEQRQMRKEGLGLRKEKNRWRISRRATLWSWCRNMRAMSCKARCPSSPPRRTSTSRS